MQNKQISINISTKWYLQKELKAWILKKRNWDDMWNNFSQKIKDILWYEEGLQFERDFCKQVWEWELSKQTIQTIKNNELLYQYICETIEHNFSVYFEVITKATWDNVFETFAD